MGIIGLMIFLGFFASAIKSSWSYIKIDNELKAYYIGIIVVLITYLFCSLFQPYFEANFVGIFLWIFLGLLSTAKNINQLSKKI
jgi:hypothetical protein